MSSAGDVTRWLQQLKTGNHDAAQPLWERYFRRLVALARDRLRKLPRTATDEENAGAVAVAVQAHSAWAGRSSFPAPHGRFGGVQVLERRADADKVAARVRGVAGGRLQARNMRLPEAVELPHQQLAQVLAGHRRQGDAEVLRIRTRLEGDAHLRRRSQEAVRAASGT